MNNTSPRILLTLALALQIQTTRLPAVITVDSGTVVRQIPAEIGGVNIFAHDNPFATNRDNIPYQSDLGAAGIRLVRTVTYPDPDAPSHGLAYFDDNVAKIKAQGAQPLFVLYFTPNTAYLNASGTTGGGTLETNIVQLVNRYKNPPFNFTTQYWEMHNEPEHTVDYQMTPEAYAAQFNSIHDALEAAGLRGNVVLCGPATMNDYGWGDDSTLMMNHFLQYCKNSVDVVTRHIYGKEDDENYLLNGADRIDRQWNGSLPVAGSIPHGEAYLLAKMTEFGVPPEVRTGVTEFSVLDGAVSRRHTFTQALWNLIALRHAVYNPRMALTTGFLFDAYGNQVGGLGFYDLAKQRDPTWWTHYIHNLRRGSTAVGQTSSNGKLVVCATRNANYLFVEVINRDITNAITDTVTISNASLGSPTMFHFSGSVRMLETGTASTYGASFSHQFPAKSVTIFRYPLATPSGRFSARFESAEGYSSGTPLTSLSRWTGTPALFAVGSGGNGGQCALAASSTTSVAAFSNVSFAAAASDFGGNAAPITPGFSGTIQGSLDLAALTSATVPDTTAAWFLRIGGADQLELFVRANRNLEIRSSAGNFLAKNADTTPFVLNGFCRIEYAMNYASQTTRLKINGVEQSTAAGALDIPWKAPVTSPSFTYVRLQNNVATTSDRYVRIKVDNLSHGLGRDPVIDFEPNDGYFLSNSLTQYPLPWTGSPASIFKVEAVGFGGSQGIHSAAKTGATLAAFGNANHTATAAEFSGNAQPVTAGYAGLVAGSFDLAITEPAATQDGTQSWFLRVGDNGQFEMFLRANGRLEIRSTAGNIIARTATGAEFVSGPGFTTVSYVMNYATKTVQVWVNGVCQTTAAGSVDIPWQANPATPSFAYLRLQNNLANSDARYPRIKLDNITYYVP